jgi:hypothetical protein
MKGSAQWSYLSGALWSDYFLYYHWYRLPKQSTNSQNLSTGTNCSSAALLMDDMCFHISCPTVIISGAGNNISQYAKSSLTDILRHFLKHMTRAIENSSRDCSSLSSTLRETAPTLWEVNARGIVTNVLSRFFLVFLVLSHNFRVSTSTVKGARCSVVVKVLCYKPEGRGFKTRWNEWIFFSLPNPCRSTRPSGSFSL